MSTSVQREIEQFTADVKYFDAHRKELSAQYPDQWVAVYRGRVVGAARKRELLYAQLEKAGISRGSAFIEFTTESDDLLIL
jgi:hypothetical protein